MIAEQNRMIVVTGATGLQGGAVARRLRDNGWQVRAVTRSPRSEKARALAALGMEVVQADLNDLASLSPVFAGAYGVFSVQNPMISGMEGEIRQGKHVAEAARQYGMEHLVYASAGIGVTETGIPSWESKQVVEGHIRSIGIPYTFLRPMAFMELMTDKKFFPQIAAWQVMPAMMGSSRKLPWLSAEDVGVIAARAFEETERFVGQELQLLSDVQSIDECREIYRDVVGRNPPRFPMPAWIFERFGFVGKDLSTMWRWLRTGVVDLDPEPTRQIHPEALTVRRWLEKRQSNE